MGTDTEGLSTTPRDIDATRADLTRDLDELTNKVSPQAVVQRQKDAVKSRIGSARDKVMGSSGSMSDGPGAATQVKDSTQSAVAGHPLTAGLVAFGAGMLLSALLPASKAETDAARHVTEAAEEHGQPLVDHAKGVAQEVGSDLKESAVSAAEEVKSSAQESAAQVKGEARSSAATVKDDATS
jgi:vacuolar-type H+-ATPase subunit H